MASTIACDARIRPPCATASKCTVRSTGVPKQVVVAALDRALVQSAADAQCDAACPACVAQRVLQADACANAGLRPVEGREETISCRLDDDPAPAPRRPRAMPSCDAGADIRSGWPSQRRVLPSMGKGEPRRRRRFPTR